MTAYEVTAANEIFWQKLRVAAKDPDEADAKFRAYLAAPEQQQGEEEEFEQGLGIHREMLSQGEDVEEEAPTRDVYSYQFDIEKIEELDDWETATDEVKMIRSGGNG